MLIYYLCFSNQHGEVVGEKPNAQQFTKRDFKAFFNSHFSFIKVGWLQGCVSILLAFHKIRIPHESTVKAQQNRVQLLTFLLKCLFRYVTRAF